jgi:hypothetical protein
VNPLRAVGAFSTSLESCGGTQRGRGIRFNTLGRHDGSRLVCRYFRENVRQPIIDALRRGRTAFDGRPHDLKLYVGRIRAGEFASPPFQRRLPTARFVQLAMLSFAGGASAAVAATDFAVVPGMVSITSGTLDDTSFTSQPETSSVTPSNSGCP